MRRPLCHRFGVNMLPETDCKLHNNLHWTGTCLHFSKISRGRWGKKNDDSQLSYSKSFPRMCYSCNNTRWASWLCRLHSHICDLLCSAVAKDTICAWRRTWRQTMLSSSWVYFPEFCKCGWDSLSSTDLCDCFYTLFHWLCDVHLPKAGNDSICSHMCWKEPLKMTDLWHKTRAADVKSTLSLFPSLSIVCVSFTDEGWNLYQTNRTNIRTTWGISLSDAVISNPPTNHQKRVWSSVFPFFHGKVFPLHFWEVMEKPTWQQWQ